jgi:hypothetical protein
MYGRSVRALAAVVLTLLASVAVRAQDADEETHDQTHDMSQMDMASSAWRFMQDGSFSAVFNHQGGPRGGNQVTAVNWWMGMLSRPLKSGQLTLSGMFSLEPATVGTRGYRELFQSGEAVDDRPNIDHQHPHDAFMQLSASWAKALSASTAVSVAAAPAGEPALGPIAFMHRASAAAILFAPLGHHTFDATHVSFGVVTGGVSRGRWGFEGSVFNGREPDQHRWDVDLAAPDSVSGRVWFRPSGEWAFQVSTGHLVQPEALEPGNVTRTTASTSWTRARPDSLSAMTVGYGRNDRAGQQAAFGEFTSERGACTLSSRLEFVQIENELLADDLAFASTADRAKHLDAVGALTLGAIRRVGRWGGLETGVGMNATVYAVPEALRTTYGAHPFSFQLFVQVRPHFGNMGPMWNMRMGE